MQSNKQFSIKNTFLKLLSYIYPAAKRGIKKFHGGIFPKYNKELSNRHPLTLSNIPAELVLPLKQHIGVEVEPLVKVGDKVLKNQLIADAEDKQLRAPIHSPTSGVIKAIENRQLPHASGLGGMCIVIKTDGFDTEFLNPLQLNGEKPSSPALLKDIIYRAGIVGMGGAGFPTFAKLPNEKGKITTLIINGAECEPFITCDDLLMQSYPLQILSGAEIVASALGCKQVICGIEDNKQQAIKKMQQAVKQLDIEDNLEIRSIPTIYPMGGDKQLIKEILNIEVTAGIPASKQGILVMNVSTMRAIHQAVINGKPLTSRLVTVSGLGIKSPYNTEAMLGTSFTDLVKVAEPKTELNYPLIQGGPMMGFEVPNNDVPIVKTTNCVLANPPEQKAGTMPCIRCGECMDACPVNLLPQQLYWHSRSHEFEKTEELNLFDCIECGSCSFVCPSNIPLVQYYRYAKSEVRKQKVEQEATDIAKLRHENKLAREEKQKAEKAAKLQAKKDAIKKKALEAQSEEKPAASSDTAKSMSARDKALAAAAKRKAAKAENTTEEPPKEKFSPREAALAAAAKRKAVKTAKANVITEEPVKEKHSPREAALAAAAKRKRAIPTKVKDTPEEQLVPKKPSQPKKPTKKKPVAKKTPTQAAEDAKKKKSVAKKDPRQSAVDAARKRAELRKTKKNSEKEGDQTNNSLKKDPRIAAIKAAKKRAELKKAQQEEANT